MKSIILNMISFWVRLKLKYKGVSVGKNCHLYGMPFIKNSGGRGTISIADNVTLLTWKKVNPFISTKMTFWTMLPGAKIVIEKGVGISSICIHSTNLVHIGENTIIGPDCMIIDNNMHHQAEDGTWPFTIRKIPGKPVIIGKNCFIGTRSMILKGVTIGDSCVIGAGAVVSKNVPDNHMAYGNPAVVVPRKATEQPQ